MAARVIKIKYVSIIAQAQRASGVNVYDDTLSRLGAAAGALPEVLDNIDGDKYAEIVGDKMGTSLMFKDPKDRDALRQARQAAAEAAQRAQNMQNLVAGAKTASETKLGQNSALDAVMKPYGGANV
jgi:type IV secretory pathway TrbL component